MRFPTCVLLSLGAAATISSARAAGPFDGVYVGPGVQSGSSGPGCNSLSRPHAVRVAENRIKQNIGGADMEGMVGPDGSFSLWSQIHSQYRLGNYSVSFAGRITAGVMNARYDSKYCHYAFAMPRK